MGLIKTIFGGIFGLIGGIFKGILGVFGIGKKSEFYMELDEAATPTDSVPTPAPKVESAVETASAPVAPAPKPASTPSPAAPAVSTAPAPPLPSFAANYLGATPGALKRRRPGPSLSPFRDLAKQVKNPVA